MRPNSPLKGCAALPHARFCLAVLPSCRVCVALNEMHAVGHEPTPYVDPKPVKRQPGGTRINGSWSPCRYQAPACATRVEGDRLDRKTLTRAVMGVKAIVHLAAVLRTQGIDEIWRANLEGTRNLIAAAKAHV